jgi:peptide/nickel transport system ATP-binding protein
MDDAEPILSVRHLVTGFADDAGSKTLAHPVDDVSFELRRGAVLGVIGESGSGKSLMALSVLRLLPEHARVLGGQVIFEGRDLLQTSDRELEQLRGRKLAMVFQEPATALSPVHTVGWQLKAALRAAGQLAPAGFFGARRAARTQSIELLTRVALPDPPYIIDAYPHQLSAGMRRRVLIAMALAGRPALLIADEPTTGLDAPTRAQILDLFAQLTREQGMALIFVSHDLGAVAEVATDIVVMHAGQIVEAGPVRSLLSQPQHPYTLALMRHLPGQSRPSQIGMAGPDACAALRSAARSPDVEHACRFADRCLRRRASPDAFPRCLSDAPTLQPLLARHRSRCFYPHLSALDQHD